MAKSGNYVLFNKKSLKAVWSHPVASFVSPVLSPARKYVVLPGKSGGLLLVETLSGNVIGSFETPTGIRISLIASIAFSPDGKTLAAFQDGVLYSWDATNGKANELLYSDTQGKIIWTNETYMMIGDTLIDMSANYPMWRYTGVLPSDKVFAGLYWIVRNDASSHTDDNYELAAFSIPHFKMPSFKDIPDSKRYSVMPGMKVKLQIDSSVPDADKVREYLTATLKKNGLEISDKSNLMLSAKVTTLGTEKATYSTRLSMRGEGAEVSYTPHKMSVSFTKGVEKLWESETTTSASSVSIEEIANKSLQEAVNERSKPNSFWFKMVKIPVKIPVQGAHKVGESKISITGVN
jgi:WD40 repeat protein